MGVSSSVLSNTAIQSQATLAEALIKKMCTNWQAIINDAGDEKTFLETAAIAQVCALLCPGMSQRLKISQQDETGYAYRLQGTDWNAKKSEFEVLIRDMLRLATDNETYFSPLGVVHNDRLEI